MAGHRSHWLTEALGLAPSRVAVALASLAPSGLEDKTAL